MSKQQRRPAKSLRATRQKSQSRNQKKRMGTPLYKSVRPVMPQEYDTVLKYITQDTVTNIAGTLASIQFRTEAFDVDPALASTAMPGFTEFAAFYARYRPISMKYKFSASNRETFPVTVLDGFSNSAISSGSLALTYGGNPLMRTSVLGGYPGVNTKTYTQKRTVVQISGTQQALFDDVFTGSTVSATLPTSGTSHCYFGIVAPAALTAVGVMVTVEISLHLRFYRPFFLLT